MPASNLSSRGGADTALAAPPLPAFPVRRAVLQRQPHRLSRQHGCVPTGPARAGRRCSAEVACWPPFDFGLAGHRSPSTGVTHVPPSVCPGAAGPRDGPGGARKPEGARKGRGEPEPSPRVPESHNDHTSGIRTMRCMCGCCVACGPLRSQPG